MDNSQCTKFFHGSYFQSGEHTTITIKSTLTIIRLNSSNVVLNEFSLQLQFHHCPAAAGGGGAELSSVLESDEGNEYKEPVQLKVNHHGLLSSECLQWSKLKQLSCSQEIQFEKFTQNVHSQHAQNISSGLYLENVLLY